MSYRVICFFGLLLMSLTSFGETASLVSAEQLNARLTNSDIRLIAVQKSDEYSTEHLPGAMNIWRTDITSSQFPYGGMALERNGMEKLLGNIGICSNNHLVLYDAKGSVDAARLWWVLKRYGHQQVSILDGGIRAWKAAGYTTTQDSILLAPCSFNFSESINHALNADMVEVKSAINASNTLLLDTRTHDEYNGVMQKKAAFRAGHIPGAQLLDWANSIDYHGTTKFKNKQELKQLFTSHGITPDKRIIVYCQSGSRSSHTTFALTEILGYPNVSNYDGSWIEWSYFDELPIETELIHGEDVGHNHRNYWDVFINGYRGYANYLLNEITFNYDYKPWWKNYFYWLLLVSGFFFGLEMIKPWRETQPRFRKDFWLDCFYMFFNFFLFSLVIYNAASDVAVNLFNDLLGSYGIDNTVAIQLSSWSPVLQLLTMFVLRDFIQWWVHRLLHRVPWLWEFHKVHHSVEQMGFAAHLRYHWMENVVYRSLEYIPLAMIGFGIDDFFIVHIIGLAIGHWNHSNISWNIGPLKYLFNNPQMHIWHHVHDFPETHRYGINFGLSLSIWDYLFGTAVIPHNGRDIKLGFPKMEKFPKGFIRQNLHGFLKNKD